MVKNPVMYMVLYIKVDPTLPCPNLGPLGVFSLSTRTGRWDCTDTDLAVIRPLLICLSRDSFVQLGGFDCHSLMCD